MSKAIARHQLEMMGELHVVAECFVTVQGKMRSIDGEIVSHCQLEPLIVDSYEGLETAPEHAVMDD